MTNKKLTVLSVNISEKKGTIKLPVKEINLTVNGVTGDAHSGPWNRQVSLLGVESIRKFEADAGRKVEPGEFAENITTEGLELWKMKPLDRLISENSVLEVTQIGKECHGSSCAIFKEVGNCVMPKEGIFARVIKPGLLLPNERFDYFPKEYRIHVITLSDRASHGEYEDKSGQVIKERIEKYFSDLHLPSSIIYSLIPDDPDQLRILLEKAKSDQIDIVITTGGTGIGPRDFTPETVRPFLDKEIPGMMEMIRMKYGAEKPNALVSRSVAGVMGKTLVFTLPGSPKAVNEYLSEIFRNLYHLIMMIHGLDQH
jgi:molybdenum cofactor synthesis domain-containing protein